MRGLPPAPRANLARLKGILDLGPPWVQVLKVNPIPRIFRRGEPGAQLQLLTVLAPEMSDEGAVLRRDLRRVAADSPTVVRIRKRQRSDGTWAVADTGGPEGSARQLTLIGLLENLHALAVLGAHRNWPDVGRGLRALLAFQQPDGRFPLLYHHHASIGRLLMAFGQRSTPQLHKTAHWIAQRQRDDGGWLHPHMAGRRTKPLSCIWTTAEVLAFLGRYRTSRIKEGLPRAGEFLLSHALEPNATTLLPEAGAWSVLEQGSYGLHLFHGGTLKVLDGLSLAGFHPSQATFKKLYVWLLDQQLENGYFPRAAGRDKLGDPWVTVRVLEVVKRVEATRPR